MKQITQNGKYIFAIVLAFLLIGCSGKVTLLDDSGATTESVSSVIGANNQFAFELYTEFKNDPKNKDKNIFFSPYSISTALAMTYEGAKGKTAEEIQSVFHFPENINLRGPAFASIYNAINKKDKKYKLHTANALWAQEDYQFLDEYFNTVEKYYGGKVTNLDFKTETEKSRIIINKWVEKQTNDKIKDLIPARSINIMTRLVLTNAIYFKGDWLKEFDKDNTRDQDFWITPSFNKKVPMMRLIGKEAEFNYAETDNLQILELPYKGEELSMLILLPKENNLEAVESPLDAEKMSELRGVLREQRVDVYLPKFKFETKYFMADTLKEMGMPTAFSDRADFSGMDGSRYLFISNVIHQAFVDVNEEGTEAAAATAVVMGETAIAEPKPIPEFRADHSFIFIIQEKQTGSILFLGRVMDPTQS